MDIDLLVRREGELDTFRAFRMPPYKVTVSTRQLFPLVVRAAMVGTDTFFSVPYTEAHYDK